MERLDEFMRDTIAEVEIEANNPKNKTDAERRIKNLKEQLRRLNVMYMAGNKSDEEYFKEDAEIKLAISKAEKELEISRPRNVEHLKDMLETDYQTLYKTFTPEEKQEFWQDLIKEIKLDGKLVSKVLFFT
jgi:hypothetical protein